MLRSCQYCGRIHDSKYDCGKLPSKRKDKEQDRFRASGAWKKKRAEIRERDLNLCRMSLYNGEICYTGLSVHHIEPLTEAWDSRLGDDNLITLNEYYHELAEKGDISRTLLHELAISPPAIQKKK